MSSYQNYSFQYFLNENYIVNFLMLNRNIKVYHHFKKPVSFSSWLWGLSWSWPYGILIYNYLFNQCLSPLTLWVQIRLRQGVLDTTLCDQVCQWLAAGLWFSPGTLVSSTNITDCHDIAEILLKVLLNAKTQTHLDFA